MNPQMFEINVLIFASETVLKCEKLIYNIVSFIKCGRIAF